MQERIVITGVGLTAPNGDTLADFRQALLDGRGGIQNYEIRYFGKTHAGICSFDPLKYQTKKKSAVERVPAVSRSTVRMKR